MESARVGEPKTDLQVALFVRLAGDIGAAVFADIMFVIRMSENIKLPTDIVPRHIRCCCDVSSGRMRCEDL